MLAVALALAASACWGVADFTAGLKTRDLPVPLVLLVVQGVGCLWVAGAVIVTGEPFPDAGSAAASVLAGIAGGAALGALLPRAGDRHDGRRRADLGHGRRAAGRRRHRDRRPPLGRGLRRSGARGGGGAAGLARAARRRGPRIGGARRASRSRWRPRIGFGAYFVLADVAADASVLWLLLLARLVVVPVLALVVLAAPRAAAPPSGAGTRRCWPWPGRSTSLRRASSPWPRRGARSASSRSSARCTRWPPCCSRGSCCTSASSPCRLAGVAAAFAGVALIVAG